MNLTSKKPSAIIYAGWMVHLLTASGALLGLWALHAIAQGEIRLALILLAVSIIIDAIDGPLARLANVQKNLPHFDGALLDYIIDFFTWVIVPAFLLMQTDLFSSLENKFIACAIVMSTCYQFCCKDIKSEQNHHVNRKINRCHEFHHLVTYRTSVF